MCKTIECAYFDMNGNVVKHKEYGQKSAITTESIDTSGSEIITISHYISYSKIKTCTYIVYDSLFRKNYSTTWKFWNNKPKILIDSTAYFYENTELKYEVKFDFYGSINSVNTTYYNNSDENIIAIKDSNGNVIQRTNLLTGTVTNYNYDMKNLERLIEVIEIKKG